MYDLEHYNSLEPLYKKKQKRKLSLFFATFLLSILFAIGGIVLGISADGKASNTYEQKLYEASITTDYQEKIRTYQDCIAIPHKAGDKAAYLGLINAFKEDDSVFTLEEAGLLEKLIKNNKAALQEDPAAYTEICFETGKLFWYYYNYGDGSDNQLTKAKSAVTWFRDVLDNAPEGYENLGMAKVYSNIGIFYRDITTNITEASDKGQYEPLYQNLAELVDTVAADPAEREIVRLELIEMVRSALQQYATKFKVDGVSAESLLSMHSRISELIQTISTTADKTTQIKETTMGLLPDTLKAIEAAYGITTGGGTQ